MKKTWSWSIQGGQFAGRNHEEIQEICRSAGLTGIEGGPNLFDAHSDAELEAIGADYRDAGVPVETYHLPFGGSLDIASFYETERSRAVDAAKRHLERAARLGASVGIQHPSSSQYGVEVEGFDNYLRQFAKSMNELLPVAESAGVTLAIENMLPAKGVRFGSLPSHFETFAREFDHPRFRFCLDTGHALCALGLDRADEMFIAMAPKLAAFHLADNPGDRDLHLAPGRGLVCWDTIFRRMAELGFDRCACIETAPFAPGPPYSAEAYRQLVIDVDDLVRKALQ